MKRFIVSVLLLGIVLGLASAGALAWRVNDRIDHCFDDTSPAYITDNAMRQVECGE